VSAPRIEVREQGQAVVASLEARADIDISHAVELGDALLAAVPNHAAGLVLDLSKVQYLDSAGVRMLFGLARHLQTRRQELALSLPRGAVISRLIEITKLEEVAIIGGDVEACVHLVGERNGG
jgi:stage II sporulation protein AA (anti-sigma F factor antagonist)